MAATGLTVGKDTTTATVSETPTSVTYGNEGASVFTATVTTGNPHEVLLGTESATINVGSTSCTASLAPGGNGASGTCSIASTALAGRRVPPTRSPSLTAVTPTCPPPLRATAATGLTVGKDTTTATVSETPTSVTYGNEGASVFTATVTTNHHEVLPGTESATINVGSTSCTASLAPGGNGASGTCSIASTALAALGYRLHGHLHLRR